MSTNSEDPFAPTVEQDVQDKGLAQAFFNDIKCFKLTPYRHKLDISEKRYKPVKVGVSTNKDTETALIYATFNAADKIYLKLFQDESTITTDFISIKLYSAIIKRIRDNVFVPRKLTI